MNGDEAVVGSYPREGDDDLPYATQADAGGGHMAGFDHAIDDALAQWNHDGERNAKVTLSVKIKKVNPGWILRYKANLTPEP